MGCRWFYSNTIVILMRDIRYKVYAFRLNEELIKKLRKRRKQKKLSWNLLFTELLKSSDKTAVDNVLDNV